MIFIVILVNTYGQYYYQPPYAFIGAEGQQYEVCPTEENPELGFEWNADQSTMSGQDQLGDSSSDDIPSVSEKLMSIL